MEFSKTVYAILLLTSGIGWALTYILIIYRSFRDKVCGMPFWALAFNISWEFIFSFVFILKKEIRFFVRIWLVLDLAILAAYLLYGKKAWPKNISVKFFYPYSMVVLIDSFLIVYMLSAELHDLKGIYTGFIINLMMSLLFISLLNNRKSLKGQSLWIAFFKMVGTITPTILVGVDSNVVILLGSSTFAADIVYLVMLIPYYRRLNINPLIFRR